MFASRYVRHVLTSVALALVHGLVLPFDIAALECDPDPLPGNPNFVLELCSPNSNELRTKITPEGLRLTWDVPPRSRTTKISEITATNWEGLAEGEVVPGLTLSGTYMSVVDRRIELAIIQIGVQDTVGTLGVDDIVFAWSSVFEATGEGILGDRINVNSSNINDSFGFRIPRPGSIDTTVVAGVRIRFEAGTPVALEDAASFTVQDFEGFHVWRWFSDPTLEPSAWGEYSKLLGTRDPNNAWFVTSLLDSITFLDRAVFDGDVYHYAVTSFDQGFVPRTGDTLGFKTESPLPPSTINGQGEVLLGSTTKKIEFLQPPPGEFRAVAAVPNPFRQSQCDLERETATCSIRFLNMPTRGRLSIFTLAGDLVIEIPHDSATQGTIRWNTQNGRGEEVGSGVYIYKIVDLESGQESFGRLVIIR